jgi:hypothetical protein
MERLDISKRGAIVKYKIYFFLTLIIFFSILSCSYNKIQSLKKLGTEEFNKEKWLISDEVARGRMIYDFIKKNKPIENKRKSTFVFNQLGESTGYYNYDSYPAYYIGPQPPSSDSKAYLLAFIVDHKTKIIIDIYINPQIQ